MDIWVSGDSTGRKPSISGGSGAARAEDAAGAVARGRELAFVTSLARRLPTPQAGTQVFKKKKKRWIYEYLYQHYS